MITRSRVWLLVGSLSSGNY